MNKADNKEIEINIACMSCGKIISSSAASESSATAGRLCLICHARMLNEQFQRQRTARPSHPNAKETPPN